MRNDTFKFNKDINIKDLGRLKIEFLYELHIEDQEKCLKLWYKFIKNFEVIIYIG